MVHKKRSPSQPLGHKSFASTTRPRCLACESLSLCFNLKFLQLIWRSHAILSCCQSVCAIRLIIIFYDEIASHKCHYTKVFSKSKYTSREFSSNTLIVFVLYKCYNRLLITTHHQLFIYICKRLATLLCLRTTSREFNQISSIQSPTLFYPSIAYGSIHPEVRSPCSNECRTTDCGII